MTDVCALGELLIDFTFSGMSEHGQRLFEQNAGGAPAHVLVALARLGHSGAFIGKVGDDMHGRFLRDTLLADGIDCSGLVMSPDYFTTLAFVALSEDGERSFSFARKPGADTCLAPEEVRDDLTAASRVVHVGSLYLSDEPARSATIHALETAKAAGCVMSYDPNYRASLWAGEDAAREQMRSILPYMDLVKISGEETALLTGLAAPEDAAAAIVEGGATVCVVTLDDAGAYVCTAKGAETVPSFKVSPVDTTGAGDSFWGGFLAAFLESGRSLDEITLDAAAGFARFGNAVASLCVRGRGGIPSMPARTRVEDLLG